MNEDEIERLVLGKVDRFYPLSSQKGSTNHQGHLELLNSIETRINELIRNKKVLPWANFVDEAQANCEPYRISSVDYLQFPSLLLEVDLSTNLLGSLRIDRKLILAFSPVSALFTVFFQDIVQIRMDSVSALERKLKRVVYKRENVNVSEAEMAADIERSFARYYGSPVFVPHSLLFERRITGATPHGQFEDDSIAFPVYDFLFGSDGTWNDLTLVFQ